MKHALEETTRKGFRDRRAIELEITESVVGRLVKWGQWLGGIVTVIVILFGLLLGKSYFDVYTATQSAKGEIAKTMSDAKTRLEPQLQSARDEVSGLVRTADNIKQQYGELQSDIGRYKRTNVQIEQLQRQLSAVKDQIIDLGGHTLKARKVETTGSEPSSFTFGRPGCDSASAFDSGGAAAYCVQGLPPVLFQLTPAGDARPVSSSSPVGYQDTSTRPKPAPRQPEELST